MERFNLKQRIWIGKLFEESQIYIQNECHLKSITDYWKCFNSISIVDLKFIWIYSIQTSQRIWNNISNPSMQTQLRIEKTVKHIQKGKTVLKGFCILDFLDELIISWLYLISFDTFLDDVQTYTFLDDWQTYNAVRFLSPQNTIDKPVNMVKNRLGLTIEANTLT